MWPVFEPGTPFVDGWHIGCIAEHLQAVTDCQINNLIINIPPRHGKSMSSGVGWFTWGWAKFPHLRWMYNSYADSLVVRDADKSRDVINSAWYQRRWGHRFQWGRHTSVSWYDNTAGGYRMSTTVGGKATGHGADIIVADDPMKALDARSAAERMRVINWWTGTMSTRINDPRFVRKVIIMQRLHEADLAGFLAARGNYEMLVLPAEYEPKRFFFIRPATVPRDAIIATSLQRKRPELMDPRKDEGELLWKERFGPKQIADLKIELEADGVAGQLQQRPSPADGTVFQRGHFRYATVADTALGRTFLLSTPDGKEAKRVQVARCRFFQTCDTAQKTKQSNDPTAVGTFAVTPDGDLIIYHVVAERIEIPYQLAFLKAMRRGPALWSKADKRVIPAPFGWPRPLLGQWVEDASSGTMLLTSGLAEGIVFRTLKAAHDKVQRAAPLSALYEAGRVYHVRGGAWLVGFEDELATFPAAAHDDRCLVAGTMVKTSRGDVPIEDVTTADHVLTRRGWCRVNWSGVTGYNSRVWTVELDNGASLTGTGAHPVWVRGRGWVDLESLAYGDTLEGWQHESKPSNSAAAPTADTPTPSAAVIGCTTSVTTDGRLRHDCSTGTSGNRSTGRFQTVATFTTRIATRITTTLRIWCVSRPKSTSDTTPKPATGQRKLSAPTWNASDRSPWSGTDPKPAGNSTAPTANEPLRPARQTLLSTLARFAARCTKPFTPTRGFARPSAWQNTGAIPAWTTKSDSVATVAVSSSSTATPKPDAAPSVVRVRPAGVARVYNLSVDDRQEFYANGVLVHNCDVAAYGAQVALYDAIVRAGMAGLEEIAAQYAEPDPDDPGASRRPWLLEAGETLDELPDPVVTVSLGGEDIDSHDPGTGDPVYVQPPNPALPPPESDTPEDDWPEVFYPTPKPPPPEPVSLAARAAAKLMAPPGADPLSLD